MIITSIQGRPSSMDGIDTVNIDNLTINNNIVELSLGFYLSLNKLLSPIKTCFFSFDDRDNNISINFSFNEKISNIQTWKDGIRFRINIWNISFFKSQYISSTYLNLLSNIHNLIITNSFRFIFLNAMPLIDLIYIQNNWSLGVCSNINLVDFWRFNKLDKENKHLILGITGHYVFQDINKFTTHLFSGKIFHNGNFMLLYMLYFDGFILYTCKNPVLEYTNTNERKSNYNIGVLISLCIFKHILNKQAVKILNKILFLFDSVIVLDFNIFTKKFLNLELVITLNCHNGCLIIIKFNINSIMEKNKFDLACLLFLAMFLFKNTLEPLSKSILNIDN